MFFAPIFLLEREMSRSDRGGYRHSVFERLFGNLFRSPPQGGGSTKPQSYFVDRTSAGLVGSAQ